MRSINRKTWEEHLHFDVLSPLMESENKPISMFLRRDLENEEIDFKELWTEREVARILRRQLPDGSWKYPTKSDRTSADNMNQYQTFKTLAILVEMYGLDKRLPAIENAGEYLFSHQTDEGDFRGIYDKQYTPNYTAAIAELLIKAGYEEDRRLKRVFQWLLEIRQEDGGWALPFRTKGKSIEVTYAHHCTIKPDFTKPFSHMVTGVVLRAFAAHPQYRHTQEAQHAGHMLANSLFEKDNYADRGGRKYWLQFVFPFCYTDLISALDALSLLGFSEKDGKIEHALDWFIDNQKQSGFWDFKITSGRNKDTLQLWLALAVCRIFKRLYDLAE